MDFGGLINGWIDRAIITATESNKEGHQFNITSNLYFKILNEIEAVGLNVQITITKSFNMLYPDINEPSRISVLTRKVRKYKSNQNTTIHGITPCIKDECLDDSHKAAGLKTSYLLNNDSNFRVRTEHISNGLTGSQKESIQNKYVMQWTYKFFPASSTQTKNMCTYSKVWMDLYDEITEQKYNIQSQAL